MATNINALAIAWAITITAIAGTALYVELSHTPVPETEETEHGASSEDTSNLAINETASNDSNTVTDLPRPGPIEEADQAEATTPEGPAPGETDPVQTDAKSTLGNTVTTGPTPIKEPLTSLIEQSSSGPLPRISASGVLPGEYYAANHKGSQDRPRIAILVSELGLRARTTERALRNLPASVSLAFSPYSANLGDWTTQARASGREFFLMVPMEPVNYPQNDPGPLSLFVDQTNTQNIELLHATMGQATGYAGLVNHMGSRFTASPDSLRPILEEIRRRGLVFIDSRSTRHTRAASMGKVLGLSVVQNDRYVDNSLRAEDIAKQLSELEIRARTIGAAMGIARPYPVTLEALNTWAQDLEERGFDLVPVTAVVGYQAIR